MKRLASATKQQFKTCLGYKTVHEHAETRSLGKLSEKHTFLYICFCTFTYLLWMKKGSMCHGLCLEVRVQLFLPCEFWVLNSGHQALWQTPLPTVSSCRPVSPMFLISRSGTFSLAHLCQIHKTVRDDPGG